MRDQKNSDQPAESRRDAIIEELRRSEEQLRLITENTSDNIAITTFDLKAVYVYVNPSVKFLLGYDPEDLIGKSFFKFIHPDDKKVLFPLLKKYIKLKIKKLLTSKEVPISETIEFRFKNKAGSWCFMQSTVNVIGDKLLAVTRDISEHKQAEIALKSSEERLKIIFDYAPDGIYLSDFKGNFLDGNKAAEDLTGYKKEELIGKNFLNLELLSRKDLPKAATNLAKNALGKRTGPDEFVLNRKDGTQISLEISNFPVKIEDKTVVLGIARDISERKKTEESLLLTQTTLDNLADAVYWIGPDAKFIYVNNAAVEVLGYSREELLNMTVHDIGPDFPAEVWPDHWEKLKEKGSFVIHTVHQRKDKSTFPVEISVNYIRHEGKEINCAIAKDISERKQAEEELKESEIQLKNIFENSTSLFYSHTPDHIITYLSPQVKDILGYTQEEAMIKWTKLVSDNPINEAGFKHTVRAIETCKRQPPYELELVKKGGNKIQVEVREFPLVEKGKTIAIIGSLVDITERKKAEEEILKLKEGLEIEVDEKTKELKEKVSDLQRFFDATVDRELRMKELSDENEKLKAELEENHD